MDQVQLTAILTDADRRVATSPLSNPPEHRHVFLTQGGWRWHWLALQSSGSFALTRPLGTGIVLNRSDLAAGRVYNGRQIGGTRSLSAVIAHETTHDMIRRHFSILDSAFFPTWLTEGYCDHVAGESSLTAEEVARLKTRGQSHPAVLYYEGREKVSSMLAANGGSVDRLFAEAD